MTRQAFRVFYTVGLPANCKINLDINIYLQFSWKWVQEILYLTLLSFSLMGGEKKHTGDYYSFSKKCLQRTCIAFTIRK